MDSIRLVEELLLSGGEAIGEPARNAKVRRVPGGLAEAERLFAELAALGEPMDDPRYKGEAVYLPPIGRIGLRRQSESANREPTIDINATVAGVRISKLKFVGNPARE